LAILKKDVKIRNRKKCVFMKKVFICEKARVKVIKTKKRADLETF